MVDPLDTLSAPAHLKLPLSITNPLWRVLILPCKNGRARGDRSAHRPTMHARPQPTRSSIERRILVRVIPRTKKSTMSRSSLTSAADPDSYGRVLRFVAAVSPSRFRITHVDPNRHFAGRPCLPRSR